MLSCLQNKRVRIINAYLNINYPIFFFQIRLEIYKGKILANVYLSNDLLMINIETGNVEKVIDLSELG